MILSLIFLSLIMPFLKEESNFKRSVPYFFREQEPYLKSTNTGVRTAEALPQAWSLEQMTRKWILERATIWPAASDH